MVLILKKGGVEDLKVFRSISLVGSLYKILVKIVANRLKKLVVSGHIVKEKILGIFRDFFCMLCF